MTPHSYGVETLQVKRFKKTESESVLDNIVQEHPIALVYNGISHAVMMATPTDVSVFAKGFSLSEGILTSLKELYAIEVHESELGIEVNMTISSRAFAALKERRRMLVGRTGCGLCGIESLEQLQLDISKITIEPSKEWLEQIPVAISQLKDQQKITALTGGAHAAAWVVQGKIIVLFEDVGRHNALDKLLGYLAQENYDTSLGFVVMTSRASYELIRKCAQLNIGLLASISAPTSMAIRLAKISGLTLASFCRGDDFVLYT
ncbi:formate dehydrogenase accessory sulfurtransferase FdhD [Acinetobacter oleivorans]|uniref:formate dehydrogenase accessory sulfurtransferase FdhD n=1 Tax=Acinetobacter oleivorans TaxID=1148157 RepID=UPI00157FC10C|nr:formate dehydrogenase accessory sulfurtransferase FdhD [Acinetobacter oleivorans]NUF34312.1 formate dehydrogenase accessory sulfurtransferase FdhD [Acinetobacter oleivorans]